jgi:hypothetical protein
MVVQRSRADIDEARESIVFAIAWFVFAICNGLVSTLSLLHAVPTR